jgi:hypothetical protein
LNLSAATGGVVTDFSPYDIDFDLRGRIYIANYTGGAGGANNCVIRMDDIYGEDLINFTSASYDNGVTSIAVDRNNHYVYYSTFSSTLTEKLYRSSYDNTGIVSLSVQGGVYEIDIIRGMAVDDSGILFLTGANLSESPAIFRYNPATQTVENQYTTNLNTPWDVMFKAPNIYLADYIASSGGSIIQLDNNLLYITELTTDPGASGPFNGPHRFLATLNREFYIIDEYEQDTGGNERIVSFDDFSSNWSSFRASDVGETDFNFFGLC